MKALLEHIDHWRLLALLLWALPVAALLFLGALWLWQSQALLYWVLAMALCGAAGYGLQAWLARRDRQLLAAAATEPDPSWPPRAEDAWAAVEALASQVEPETWPLSDGGRLWLLGRNALDTVARHYHPQVERPLLELTVPHTLLIIERASRDLRQDITGHLPFSHQFTIGDLLRVWRWKDATEQVVNIYRAGRLVINPLEALVSELGGLARGRAYRDVWVETQRWLLREYVRKVGYYAIDLYSGRLPLTEGEPTATPTPDSRRALERAGEAAAPVGEPLRIVVLGRANAGKSSLINALFGRLTAAADVLPDTTMGSTPYRLEREGLTAALIFDTPGCDTELLDDKTLRKMVLEADLLLWVCAAPRPDRRLERERLDTVRKWLANRPDRRPPPLVVAVGHIDQLRPPREWQPPYDLANPQGLKAESIRAAVAAVATDLGTPVASVIPVCLAEGRAYNVDDALWTAILAQQDEAGRVRLLRCLEARKRAENWTLLGRQLANAGRFLLDLPKRMLG